MGKSMADMNGTEEGDPSQPATGSNEMMTTKQSSKTEGAASPAAPAKARSWGAPLVAGFCLLTAVAVMAAYQFGEGVVYINERTISDLNVFEVTGGAALGVLGVVAGLGAATVGTVGAIAAAVVGVSVGALGVAAGAVVVVGVVTGPLLLVGIIAWLVKRRYWPDVI